MLISIVIPCFQNENQLQETVDRVAQCITDLDETFEIILIDDGSTDGTWSAITQISEKQPHVSGIKLKENVGAYNAILAGFDRATGDAILVMAADGDDPPELIPQMVSMLKNTDAVLANRTSTNRGVFEGLMSAFFYGSIRSLGAKHVPDGGSDFLIVKRAVLDRCQQTGWKSGNTLIWLVQHAGAITTVPYAKQRTKPTTWSLRRKVLLFVQTINQFVPIPFVGATPKAYSVASFTDR